MKSLYRSALFIGSVVSLTFFVASPAAADTINDAASALQSGNIYTGPGVPLSPAEINSAFGGDTSIAVVLVDGSAVANNTDWTPNTAATSLFSSTGGQYETLILAHSGPGPFVVKGENAAEISEILYADYSGSAYDEVLKDAQAIVAVNSAVAPPTPGQESSSGIDMSGALLIALLGGVVAAGGAFAIRALRKNSPKAITTGESFKDRSKRIANETMNREKERLLKNIEIFRQRGLPHMAETAANIFTHLDELLVRLNSRKDTQKLQLAQLEYVNQIGKLNDAFGEDYYLYIHEKPAMWNDPDGRKREVERAAAALDNQLLENIRQVNEHGDLNFRVALESMIRSEDSPNADTMIDGSR